LIIWVSVMRVYRLTMLAPIVEKPSPIAQQLSGARFWYYSRLWTDCWKNRNWKSK